MEKAPIKKFAVEARRKLIADVTFQLERYGITEKGIVEPQTSTDKELVFDLGNGNVQTIRGVRAVNQYKNLAAHVRGFYTDDEPKKELEQFIEETAYTWFNRLIAIRFMEVNRYLPVRVLSSEITGQKLPDLVKAPFSGDLEFTEDEKQRIFDLQDANKEDDLFRFLFFKQCNDLSRILPRLFEDLDGSNSFSELLITLSFNDPNGVVYRLVNEVDERWFDIHATDEDGKPMGQVQIMGWMYQYYNADLKDQVFKDLKKNIKISKQNIPAATQLFTPDWIVRYMVENSLGRLWAEGHPDFDKSEWKYYLDEAPQEPQVEQQLKDIRAQYAKMEPEQLKVIDPCMGSGHILCYLFDVLMQIYLDNGYSKREAVRSILENNLFGLDIDKRAAQFAYFSVMMKAREYDSGFFDRKTIPQPRVYDIQESNWMGGAYKHEMGNFLNSQAHRDTLNYLLDAFIDAKEYGSILQIRPLDYEGLKEAWQTSAAATASNVNMAMWYDAVKDSVEQLIEQAILLSQKYDAVVTNPPYMGASGMGAKLADFVKKNYPDSKSDLFAVFIEVCSHMAAEKRYQATPEQKELYEALMDFESHALSYLHNNVPLEFMMSTLMRQASSCIFGLAPLLKGMVTRRLGDILSDYCDEDGALTVNELENLSMGSLEAEFRAMANHVIELSENLPQTDEKLERLLEVIETKSHQQNNKIILFSSFRHTLRYIEQHLAEKGYRVAQVNGSVKDEERLALRQRFELPVDNANAMDILLFTEVGCEGLDYQFCDFMINYDLPWNPMAIEQRIGRIDRRGQKSDTVIICNLVTEDTIDAKIYHRCLERIGVFESSIGECAGILGDMTQKINEAVFDSSLTQQEKEEKIEKIADNEVSRANEMKRLEDESKQLFGIDISGYVLDRKVMDAENPWIGERYIQALVTEYLYRILGEKKNYIQGEGAHKVLTLSGENRATLKTKLRNSRMKKSAMYNQWMDYLKGSDTRISVTFNQEEAARDRNAIFFTAVHPLVKMAAAELHKKQEVYIKLIVDASDYPVPCGDYPFLIVERTIVGMRKEVRIVPISEINLSASDFCDLLEAADYKEIPDDCTDKQWEKLSQLKREQQQQALAQLTIDVKEKCDYRRAAVLKSYQFRKEDLLTRIEAVDDESIKRMYTSQLNSLETEKNSSLNDLENIQNCAAVEENVIVRGIITVCD